MHAHALLINNLEGCESDMEKLTELYTSQNYKVYGPVSNVTYKMLKETLKEFRNINHGDNAIIIFYGYGFDDFIVTTDHYAVTFGEINREFNDSNCPSLRNKPKIFIINICFFDGDVIFAYQQESSQDQLKDKEGFSEPQNFLMERRIQTKMFSLVVEMESNCGMNGSLLTVALYEVLMENKFPKPLKYIMGSVSNRIDDLQGTRQDYICELRSCEFPLDFYIYPSKQKNAPMLKYLCHNAIYKHRDVLFHFKDELPTILANSVHDFIKIKDWDNE